MLKWFTKLRENKNSSLCSLLPLQVHKVMVVTRKKLSHLQIRVSHGLIVSDYNKNYIMYLFIEYQSFISMTVI